MKNICCVTATCGRIKLLERTLANFLAQDYQGESTMLIYNNSEIKQKLGDFKHKSNQKVILINQNSNFKGSEYTTVGEIFNDILYHIPKDTEVVTFMDDDDIQLTNHLTEGCNGFTRALEQNKLAYKPYFSYYKDSNGTSLSHNTLEPSIFVDVHYIKREGFDISANVRYHQKWLDKLILENKILVDKLGVPTFIYDWSAQIPTWKISGNDNESNFENYRKFSQDHGTGIIKPLT